MPTTRIVPTADGAGIAVHHYGDAAGVGPRVMLSHATGFHGRCWDPVASKLASSFDVWSVDHRGHGASGKAPDGRYDDWDRFVDDLLGVIDELAEVDGLEPAGWYGLGHSLGGAILVMSEARRPGTFSSLCCYEPVVLPPERAMTSDGPAGGQMAELARKRRRSFPSRQAALDNYRSKPPLSSFDPAVLRAYVEYGFVDCPGGAVDGAVGGRVEGTVELACAPEDEASVFEGAVHNGAWNLLSDVRCPVALLTGTESTGPTAQVAPAVARRLPRGGVRDMAGLDHFGPMVDPEAVAAAAAVAFGSTALGSTALRSTALGSTMGVTGPR